MHQYRQHYRQYSGDNSQAGYDSFVKKTMRFLTQQIQRSFPHSDIYLVIGNNDSYSGNYSVIPRGLFFENMSRLSACLVKGKFNRDNLLKSFPETGYYVIQLPQHGHLLLY